MALKAESTQLNGARAAAAGPPSFVHVVTPASTVRLSAGGACGGSDMAWSGLADTASHVIGCHVTKKRN
jgi:hypothetical protein